MVSSSDDDDDLMNRATEGDDEPKKKKKKKKKKVATKKDTDSSDDDDGDFGGDSDGDDGKEADAAQRKSLPPTSPRIPSSPGGAGAAGRGGGLESPKKRPQSMRMPPTSPTAGGKGRGTTNTRPMSMRMGPSGGAGRDSGGRTGPRGAGTSTRLVDGGRGRGGIPTRVQSMPNDALPLDTNGTNVNNSGGGGRVGPRGGGQSGRFGDGGRGRGGIPTRIQSMPNDALPLDINGNGSNTGGGGRVDPRGGGRSGRFGDGGRGRGGIPTRISSMPSDALENQGTGNNGGGRGRGRAAPERRVLGRHNSMPASTGAANKPKSTRAGNSAEFRSAGDRPTSMRNVPRNGIMVPKRSNSLDLDADLGGDLDDPPAPSARSIAVRRSLRPSEEYFQNNPLAAANNKIVPRSKPESILKRSSHHNRRPIAPVEEDRVSTDGSLGDLSDEAVPLALVSSGSGGSMHSSRNMKGMGGRGGGRGPGRGGGGGRGLTASGHYRQPSKIRISDPLAAGGSISNRNLDVSGHSKSRFATFASTRSVLTQDRERDIVDTNPIMGALRFIRILPPHKDEKPIKKWIRIMSWATLFCEFVVAVVSITTYAGTTMCCGKSVLSIGTGDTVNWNRATRITTWVYLIMILVEVSPVLREGIPVNLLNPLVGFLITFAVFFNDRVTEAISMWVIECIAVACECVVYRLELKLFHSRTERMDQVEKELEPFRSNRKKKKLLKQSTRKGMISTESLSSDDEDSFGEGSFHDEEFGEESSGADLSQIRELRLLRERRILRQKQAAETLQLRYHFTGVVANLSLMGIAMVFIVSIATAGGLCIRDFIPPNPFKRDQVERCYMCKGTTGVCEVCLEDSSQCYYPYY
jgi:hypothetical protein